MKKIFIFIASAAIMFISVISCSETPASEITANSIELTDTGAYVSPEVGYAERSGKVVATLQAVGYAGYCSASVSYLLIDNGDVVIINSAKVVVLPYTAAEAKVIMLANMDTKPEIKY